MANLAIGPNCIMPAAKMVIGSGPVRVELTSRSLFVLCPIIIAGNSSTAGAAFCTPGKRQNLRSRLPAYPLTAPRLGGPSHKSLTSTATRAISKKQPLAQVRLQT